MALFDPTPPRRLTLEHPNGETIAVEVIDGSGPAIVWLPGYGADMNGTKASFLANESTIWGWRFIRFDYRGESTVGGKTEAATLSRHLEDLQLVIEQVTDRPVILAGSSMGGWLALRYLALHPQTVTGLLGVAVAPDFTTYLSEDDNYNIPASFIVDAKRHLLHDAPIRIDGPAAFIHGMRDRVAPYELSLKAANLLTTDNVEICLVKTGEHDLNRPQDLRLLWQMLARLREQLLPADA